MAGFNFGGLGFTFFGKDVTLAKTLNTVSEGFQTVWAGLKNLAGNASRMTGRIAGSFKGLASRGRGLLGAVTGALDNMAQKALSPNIDNALSGTAAQFRKTWGEITVGMNLNTKEASRWKRTLSSAAYSLNSDWGEAAKSWAAFRTHGIKLTEAMGKKGMSAAAKTLIKITSTLGIEGKQLALIYSGLVKGFGFTTKRVRQLTDVVFSMGKKFNMGKQVIQGLPGIMDVLNKELAGFTKGMKPEDIEKFTHSIVKLGVGFKEGLGSSAEDALELSKNLFSTLAQETKGIQRMFIGMGDNSFSPIIKALAEKGGVHKAFQMIMADPAKFMGAIRKMTADTEKRGGKMSAGFLRLKTSITKALGSNVSFLATGKESWDKASKSMKVLDKMLLNQKKLYGSLAKAAKKSYGDALSKGDHYQRMLVGFNMRLKKLSEPALNKWIKMQKKGFDDLMKKLGGPKGLANKKGPVGELTRRLLLMQRVGLSGLFVGMKGLGPVIQMVVTNMGPLLSALAAAGVSLMFLGKLLMPGGILLLGLMLFNKNIREKVLSGLKMVWDYAREKLPAMWPKIKEGMITLWDKAIAGMNWLMDVVSPMMIRLADAIAGVDWGGLTLKVLSYAGKFFRGVFEAIFGGDEAVAGVTAGVDTSTNTAAGRFASAGKKLAGAIGKALKVVVLTIGKQIYKFFFDWSMGFEAGVEKKGKLIGGIFVMALFFGSTRRLLLRGLAGVASAMYGTIAAMLTKMYAWAAAMATQWGVAFWPVVGVIAALAALGVAFYALTGKLGPTAKKIATIILHPFLMLWDLIKPLVAAIKALWKGDLGGFFKQMGIFMLRAITFPFRYVAGMAENAVSLITNLWGRLRARLSDSGKGILDAIAAPFKLLWSTVTPFIDAFKALASGDFLGFFKGLGKGILLALIFPFRMAWVGIKSFYGLITNGWTALRSSLGATGQAIMDAISWPFRATYAAAAWTVGAIKTAFTGLWAALKFVANLIWQVISFPFKVLYVVVKAQIDAVVSVWNYLKDSLAVLAQGIWDMISFPWRKLYELAGIVWGEVKAGAQALYDGLAVVFGAIWSVISAPWRLLAGIAIAAWEKTKAAWGVVVGWFTEKWNKVKEIASGIWNGIKDIILVVVNAVKQAWAAFTGWLGEQWDKIKGKAAAAWSAVKGAASSAWGSIKGWASSAGSSIKGAFTSAGEGMSNLFGESEKVAFATLGTAKSVTAAITALEADRMAKQIEVNNKILEAEIARTKKEIANQTQVKQVSSEAWNSIKNTAGGVMDWMGAASASVTNLMAGHMNATSQNSATTWNNVSSSAAQGNTNVARASASGANQSAAAYGKMRSKIGGEMNSIAKTGVGMHRKITQATAKAAKMQIQIQMAQLAKQGKFTKETARLQEVLTKIDALKSKASRMDIRNIGVSTSGLRKRLKLQTKLERDARIKFYNWWATRIGPRAKAIKADVFGQEVMPMITDLTDQGVSLQQALQQGMAKFQKKLVVARADQLTQLYAQLQTGQNLFDLPKEQREAFRKQFRKFQSARAQRIFRGIDLGGLTGKNVELSPAIIAALKRFDPKLKTGETGGARGIGFKTVKGGGFTAATGAPGAPGALAARRAQMAKRQVSTAISADTKAAMADVSVAISQLTAAIRTFRVTINISGDIGDYITARSKQAKLQVNKANASKYRNRGVP